MNEITTNEITISTNENGIPCVSSLEVAKHFEKQHKHVLESIENLAAENPATKIMFIESTYPNRGKEYKCYDMTRDGFTLLAMGFTGKKALEWKLKYIQAFNAMEEYIKSGAVSDRKAPDNSKTRRLDIQEKNANARLMKAKNEQAKLLLEFAKLNLSPASKELLAAKSAEILTGEKILALPETEKTYSAGEVGAMLGVSANKIGRTANANGLKTDEYGINVLDTAPNGKQIPTFRYNQRGIDKLREILKS